jgi:starvation-inducible outer membrane lipoprotein
MGLATPDYGFHHIMTTHLHIWRLHLEVQNFGSWLTGVMFLEGSIPFWLSSRPTFPGAMATIYLVST